MPRAPCEEDTDVWCDRTTVYDEAALLDHVHAHEGQGREILDAATPAMIGRAPVQTVADLDAPPRTRVSRAVRVS